MVDLTSAGRASLETIARACDLSERQALEGLSEKEVRTLLKLLRSVDGNLRGVIVQDGDKTVAEEF